MQTARLPVGQRVFGGSACRYCALSSAQSRRRSPSLKIVRAIAQPGLRTRDHVVEAATSLERFIHNDSPKALKFSFFKHGERIQEITNNHDDEDALERSWDAETASTTSLAATKPRVRKSGEWQLPAPLQAIVDRVTPRVQGLVMLNVLVVLVATNWVVLKDAGNHFDPLMFASLRFGVAALALSPFLAKVKPATLLAGLELGVYTAAGYLAQSQGLLTTDASRASFLSTFTVLVVPFLAGMTGKGVKPITWAAAVAALVGVSLLENSGAPPCMGDAWSVLSAVAFGVQIFRTEHFSRLLGRRQVMPLMSVVLATTAMIATFVAGVALPDVVHTIVTQPAAALVAAQQANIPWGSVLYTGLLTTDVALLMELMALRYVTSTEASVVYTLEPVLGAGLAFAVLGERWGPSGWVGAAIIVVSCLGVQIFGKEEGEPVLDSESE